jgi:hypothetical protein
MRNGFTAIWILFLPAGASIAQAQSSVPTAEAPSIVPSIWFIYAVIGVVFVAAFVVLAFIRASIEHSSFSLGDALSEEAQVTVMDKDQAGNQFPRIGPDGKPVMMTALVGSTSRVIALMGALVILVLFIGFGVSVMFYFAAGEGVPRDVDKVVNFMLAGLTLFAPYAVNKFASIFDLIRRP